MPLSEELIIEAVERFWREIDRYAKLAEFVGEACRKMLETNVIRGSVQWRAKNPDRLGEKLRKFMGNGEHSAEFTDLDSIFRVTKDLAGARITTYLEADRPRVISLLQKEFRGFGQNYAVVPEKRDNTSFYRATHCMVQLSDDDLVGRYQNLKGLGCEVQVCSFLAHVYNEIEHDLVYKPRSGDLSRGERDLLDALGHLVVAGDTIVNQTLEAVTNRQTRSTSTFEDEYDFVARMRSLFPQAVNFATNAGQLFEVCMKLGLDSPGKIQTALSWEDTTSESGHKLADDLAAVVNQKEGIQLEIDPLSSDQLLVLLLDDPKRLEKLRELYPAGRGIGRGPRFLSVARHLSELPKDPGRDSQ